MHYLEIPVDVLDRADARELVRFWVCDGEDFVTLMGELWGDKEPEIWGSVAADIMKHAAIKICLENTSLDRAKVLSEMKEHCDRRLAEIQTPMKGRLGD